MNRPIRCLSCNVTFTHLDIYLHPSHRCTVPPPKPTAPAQPRTDAKVIPLFEKRR